MYFFKQQVTDYNYKGLFGCLDILIGCRRRKSVYVIFDDLCQMKKGSIGNTIKTDLKSLGDFIGEENFGADFGQTCVPHGFA